MALGRRTAPRRSGTGRMRIRVGVVVRVRVREGVGVGVGGGEGFLPVGVSVFGGVVGGVDAGGVGDAKLVGLVALGLGHRSGNFNEFVILLSESAWRHF